MRHFLVLAGIGLSIGLVLSVAVGMVVLTTLLTPPILRILFQRPNQSDEQQAAMSDPAA